LAEIHEVRRLGGRDSTFRSADQTAAALFWHCAPPGLWTELAGAMLGRVGDIDLLTRGIALVAYSVGQARALVATQTAQRPMPRPVEFIRGTAPSRRAANSLDPEWEPLARSTRKDGYPSATCVIGGTVAGLLRALLGNDGHPISLTHEVLGVTRSIPNFTAMLQEIEDSRIWCGTHVRSIAVESTELGLALARELYRTEASPSSSLTSPDSRA
jgi:hypothetical protein